MFSEALRILDSNTIDFMIDNLKQTIAEKDLEIAQQDFEIAQKDFEIAQKNFEINQLRAQLAKEQDQENDEGKNSFT